jgi:hypothetical protein
MQRRSFLSRFLGAICGILSSPFSTKELVPYKIIKTIPLNVDSKQLKAKWTIDIHQDLVRMHGKINAASVNEFHQELTRTI